MFKGEQRKAPLPKIFIQAHIVLLMKLLPLKLARAVTGNSFQNEARRDVRLVGYVTPKISVHTAKVLALKGHVHKDQGNRKLPHVPWSSAQDPKMNNTTHECQKNPSHSKLLFLKRVNGPCELLANFAGGREEWSSPSEL